MFLEFLHFILFSASTYISQKHVIIECVYITSVALLFIPFLWHAFILRLKLFYTLFQYDFYHVSDKRLNE